MNEDWKELGQAVEECKRAFWAMWTPILTPILEFLERVLSR